MPKLLVVQLADDTDENRAAFRFPEGSFGVNINLRDQDMQDLIAYPKAFAESFIVPAVTALSNEAIRTGTGETWQNLKPRRRPS